jgi:hypothetical protein
VSDLFLELEKIPESPEIWYGTKPLGTVGIGVKIAFGFGGGG